MPVQFKDYYEILGVPRTASRDDIRKAFRALARKHHPDMVKQRDKAGAETKFKEINEAYEVLNDPEKRSRYDELGAGWQGGVAQQPPGWGGGTQGAPGGDFHFGGTGFSDFFEAFFGGAGRQGGGFQDKFRGAGQRAARGTDIEADIMVTLEEAMKGSARQISFRRSQNAKMETYNVRVPAGVRERQRIRLAGQGSPGPGGGAAGDLYLNVRFAPHSEFEVEGADLVHELELAPWQCVLGCEVSVPTIEGRANLRVPPGTQDRQRFRLKQRGLAKADGTRGDLYVAVTVTLPRSVTPGQRELWERLAKESA
jgi:curved DNA-binding protein